MSDPAHERLRRLFDELLTTPAEERDALLDARCGDDVVLRRRVEAMVSAAEDDSFLGGASAVPDALDKGLAAAFGGASAGAGEGLAERAPSGESAGDRIDRYELLEEIGEGGMGTVWMAEQREPVERRVALKVIKLGMDTREVVVRFEAERQALALMDHPHIAKVLDGGATEGGRPYFVMELVSGTPITAYCDNAKLGLRERLELFTKVCEGIQHAHQKGIIHRDIKPSNVLVALHDGVPVPKVIDFGIAKATSAELTQKTLFTRQGQIIGTPEYMAPEQAEMSGLDIDTRADVYALGALLYEMLTGTKLFEMQEVLEAGFQELLRVIQEVEPPRPSTRVSTMGEAASPIAANRHVNVDSLSKRLSGDLDWIVMKALEKDRRRRYETANGFAADVRRFLHEEPVVAAPPSATYRLRKFVRRRKKTVVAVGVIAFLLVAGSVGTGIGWWNTQRANEALGVALDEKDAALIEEERQRTLAQENEERARDAEAEARAEAERATRAEGEAEARAAELEQVAEFQSSQLSELDPELMGVRLRRSLIDAVPEERRERLTEGLAGLNFTNLAMQTLEENLFERTIEAIDAQFEHQPLVQARLLTTIGWTLGDLGLLDLASDPLKRSLSVRRAELGDEHADTFTSMAALGFLLFSQGRLDDAELYYREALDGQRRALGDEHPDTLVSIINMGSLLKAQGRLDEAEPYHKESMDGCRRSLGDEHPNTLASINNMAGLLRTQGRLDEAETYSREALEGYRRVFGDEHPDTLTSLGNMGALLLSQGRFDEAEPYHREALDGRRRTLGDEHPSTLHSIGTMGDLLRFQERVDEAEPYYREALDGSRRVLGNEHPETLQSINDLGFLLWSQGRLDEAETYFREALDGRRRRLGDEHPDTLASINSVGAALRGQGRLDEAEPYHREALEGFRRSLGDEHSSTLRSISNMAALLQAQGRLDEAEPYYREALDGRRRTLGDEHPDTLVSISNMAALLQRQGRLDEAETYSREVVNSRRRTLGDEHPRTLFSIFGLGILLYSQGRLDEAEPYYREALDGRRRVLGDEHRDTLDSFDKMRALFEQLVQSARDGGDDDRLGRALSDLGAHLLLEKKPTAAEPVLAEALDVLLRAAPDGPLVQRVMSDLGASLLARGGHAEARPLLEESAEWMLAHPTDPAAGLGLQRVVGLFDAWHTSEPGQGFDSLAEEWREKLEAWMEAHGEGDSE